jgi:hypothetical protein
MKNTNVQRLQVVQKQKCYVDWTIEKKSKNMFMETIQHMQS